MHIYIYIYILFIRELLYIMSYASPPIKSFRISVLESNFPGDSLYNSTDMRIPTP